MMAGLLLKRLMLILTGTPLFTSIGDFRSYMFLYTGQSIIDVHLSLTTNSVRSLNRNFTSSRELLDHRLVEFNEGADDAYINALFAWANQDLPRRK